MKKIPFTSLHLLSALLCLSLAGCSADSDSASPARAGESTGKGGSMARFAVSGNQLYTISENAMQLFDVTDATQPAPGAKIPMSMGVETIFPYNNHLFIGTRTGMHIYQISNPAQPQHVSTYQHIYSCDPVVVQGSFAYATLRTDGPCTRGTNELQVIDVSNLAAPRHVTSRQMQNPKGLGVDGHLLFVADNGLQVYQLQTPTNPQLIQTFPIQAYDVIPLNGNLLVSASDGLYQYSYQHNQIDLLSKIDIVPLP